MRAIMASFNSSGAPALVPVPRGSPTLRIRMLPTVASARLQRLTALRVARAGRVRPQPARWPLRTMTL